MPRSPGVSALSPTPASPTLPASSRPAHWAQREARIRSSDAYKRNYEVLRQMRQAEEETRAELKALELAHWAEPEAGVGSSEAYKQKREVLRQKRQTEEEKRAELKALRPAHWAEREARIRSSEAYKQKLEVLRQKRQADEQKRAELKPLRQQAYKELPYVPEEPKWPSAMIRAAGEWIPDPQEPVVTGWGTVDRQHVNWEHSEVDSVSADNILHYGCWGPWAKRMHVELLEAGLWARVRHSAMAHSEVQQEAAYTENTLAINLIMARIDTSLKTRVHCDHTTSAYRYWSRVKIQAQTFRFLDLPRELRDHVYELQVAELNVPAVGVDPQLIIEDELLGPVWPISSWAARPALLSVSKQLRIEASKVYYARNTFAIVVKHHKGDTPTKTMSELALWRAERGVEAAKHLRRLVLWVTWENSLMGFTKVDVSFSSQWGLRAFGCDLDISPDMTLVRRSALPGPELPEIALFKDHRTGTRTGEYCAMVDARRRDEGWESTGIIEFFMADPDAFFLAAGLRDKQMEQERYYGN
ncbi:hypothetical protein LTR08_000018 [Meristemomyces frigidus]|nr:hypothetical protein LTR08_000018 [Meristemomyces frigidus]